MTELAEPVAAGTIPNTDDPKCPFDHDGPPDRNKRNILIGKGPKLASKMRQGKKTDLYDKEPMASVENPRYIEGHPFFSPDSLKVERKIKKRREQWPVLVTYEDGTTERLPVRCAAHHLIPAQESLQHSKILAYMVKKSTSEALKTEGPFTDGEVWCDVGYDTNGTLNGLYLPGSYAVGGGRGGLKLWDTSDQEDSQTEGDSDAVSSERPLTGSPETIGPDCPKWQYVSQAILQSHSQFHDRHEDYSLFVLKKLDELALQYKEKYDKNAKSPCPDCEKKKSRWKKAGNPTPANLIARMDALSGHLRGFLNGSKWAVNIYTSKWMHQYMKARRSGKRWAKL